MFIHLPVSLSTFSQYNQSASPYYPSKSFLLKIVSLPSLSQSFSPLSKYDLPELTPDLSNCGPVKPVHFSFLSQFNHFYILSLSNQTICHLCPSISIFYSPSQENQSISCVCPSKTNVFSVLL